MIDILLAIMLFVISFDLSSHNLNTTPFHPDESRWLNRSYYIEDILHPFGPTWQDYYLTRGQPPLGSYMMGIGQLVQDRPLHPNIAWDFFFDSERGWNELAGAMPSRVDLHAGRRTSAFVGALVVAALFFLGRRLTNRAGGILGALFLAFHPLHIHIGSQALSDQLLNLLLTLTFLAAFAFARRPTWGWAITLGILFGLGGAAKLTPLLLSIPAAFVGCLFVILHTGQSSSTQGHGTKKSTGIKLLVQPLVAYATFIAVYPYLWISPLRRTYYLFEFRVDEMAAQGMLNDYSKVENIWVAFSRIGSRIGDQFQTTTGPIVGINSRFGLSIEPAGYDLILGCAGLLLLVVLVCKHGVWSSHALVALLMLAEAGTIVLGLRSDQYRYQLPMVLLESICVSVLTGVIWRSLGSLGSRPWARTYLFLGPEPGRLGASPHAPAIHRRPARRTTQSRISPGKRSIDPGPGFHIPRQAAGSRDKLRPDPTMQLAQVNEPVEREPRR